MLDEIGNERLRDCFDCTDWQVFIDSCENLDELTNHVSAYINFCEGVCSKEKIVKCYGNNKPWVSKELKLLLKEKKRVFRGGDKAKIKSVHNQIKGKIEGGKINYKEKVESKFRSYDSKGMWDGMKRMVGYNNKQTTMKVDKGNENKYADDLNTFYARFDCYDFSRQTDDLRRQLLDCNDDPIKIDEHQVRKTFLDLKPNKACGPDGLKPKILKTFCKELSYIFTHIFNLSLYTCSIPMAWKTSKIIPVPKSNSAKEMNDFRPVALTSVTFKCLEKLVLTHILPVCKPFLDPYQFAYKSKRGVEDAILLFTNNVYSHLDVPKSYVRTLFIDFSSAFNTIQPHLLIPKLLNMGVSKNMSMWILDFLTNRPQFVCIKTGEHAYNSSTLTTNTGAPQGTVLAPILFSIYTNDCTTTFSNIPIIKYADDTSIQALITSPDDLENYKLEVLNFVNWCDTHFLQLNVKKTKELIFDFRIKNNSHDLLNIKDESVERVSEFKYLGIIFDEKLEWHSQTNKIQKKLNQRLFFMRKLNSFYIDKTLLALFYKTCVLTTMTFCLTAWGGNARVHDKSRVNRALKSAAKMLNEAQPDTVDLVLSHLCNAKLVRIRRDETHPLYPLIKTSHRSGRLLHIKTKTNRHLNSFLPYSIRNYRQ